MSVAAFETGAAVAGVPVHLQCPGLVRTVASDERGHVLFPLVPAGRCSVTAESGRPLTAEVDVPADATVEVGVPLCTGSPEGCDVPAATVRERRFASATSFDALALATTPRPSDAWSILRDVPGIVLDRSNVGGSDTAQQALLVSGGDPGSGARFAIDGIDVTDPAALGSSGLFPDVDALERVDVRTSALDVRVRTPGVQVGLRLREPGDRFGGAAHVRGSGGALQSDNLPAALEGRPFFRNRTTALVETGLEAGGPVRRDRLWLFGAGARNTLRQDTFTEHPEELRTSSLTGKARLRLGRGFVSLLAIRSEKVHEDRDTTLSAAPAARWRQSGPSQLLSAQDRRDVGSWSVATRVSWMDAGFRLEPQGGTTASALEDYRGVFQGSYYGLETTRRRLGTGAEAASRRRAFGLDHQLLAGLGYDRAPVATDVAWPGNQVIGLERDTVFFRAFRLTGFALPTRPQSARSVQEAAFAYVQDTVVQGRWALTGGVRFELVSGHNRPSSVGANPVFPELLPAVSYGGASSPFRWRDVLPRLGVSCDMAGGQIVGRVSYAAFAGALGSADVTFDNPIGRDYASVTYYWNDRDGNGRVDRGELDLLRGRLGASGVSAQDPSSTASPNAIDPELRAPRTHELKGGMELSLSRRWKARASVSYRRNDGTLWRPLRNLTTADYAIRGAVQGTLFEREYSVGYYSPASQTRIVPGNGRLLENREGYHQDTFTTELALAGAVGPRLRFDLGLALSDWREYFDDRALSVQDPTPLENEPLLSGGMVTVRPAGLGRGDLVVNARWTVAAGLHATLPRGFAAAARLHARDGFPVPYFRVADTGDPTGPAKNVLVSPQTDTYRLPALVLVDLRLERPFRLGPGFLVAALDVFNVFNRGTTLQAARDVELPSFDRPREILRPRLARLGLAYRF